MVRTEDLIISNLLYDEEYARIVLPNVDLRYFSEKFDSLVVKTISKFFGERHKLPSKKILAIELSKEEGLSDSDVPELVEFIQNIEKPGDEDKDWLLKTTEDFFKKKAVYNAILDSLSIIGGNDKSRKEDAIPTLLSDALSVSFDRSIGHDYFADAESRYEFYHRKEEKCEFDIELFNKITKGGLPKKTLSVAMAATGVGKSLFMCHMSSGAIKLGYNVLYISMEMAEEKLAERLDMNLLNMDVDDLHSVDKKTYMNKLKSITAKQHGEMIIRQFPTGGAHVGHFRALMKELQVKKKFKPDIVFVDYLNICASQKMKANSGANSYSIVKSVAEEVRGLAIEFDVPIVSATQVNRNGFGNSDIELTDTSESMGLTHTVDFMFALISTEELEKQNQIMVKQLKNRYGDLNYYKKFVIGIDRSKMRLYDTEQSAQSGISGAGNVVGFKPSQKANKFSVDDDEDDGIPVFDRGTPNQASGFGDDWE
jgi:archaellum biogenesis ATPase FlaH